MLSLGDTFRKHSTSQVAGESRSWLGLYLLANCKAVPEVHEPVENQAHIAWCDVAIGPRLWLTVYPTTRPLQMRET